jgi:dTMP kinase
MTKNKKQKKTKYKGKLIVIDGTDGSGKATQVDLLINRLKNDGREVRMVDFPEYYKNFFGDFIGHCLAEQYYNFVHVHPKIASVLYAADRFESKEKIELWLKKGYVVIANRYVSANQIHQGGKISNLRKRQDFLRWLDDMEFRVFGIPRPNIIFYLNVPLTFNNKLLKERNKKTSRVYLRRKEDVHERDVDFMKNSYKSAMWLAKTQAGWNKIDCVEKNKMRDRENIHEEIYVKVKKVIK